MASNGDLFNPEAPGEIPRAPVEASGRAWVHTIGLSHYATPAKFIREAKKLGVSRRIAKPVLKKMAWGDVIYLGMYVGGRLGTIIIGYFYLTRIEGIKVDAAALVAEGYEVEVVSVSGIGEAIRGCGTRAVGGLYAVTNASVETLAERGDVTDANVAGVFYELPQPYPALKNVPFTRGTRPLDGEAFVVDYLAAPAVDRVVLEKFYYVETKAERTRRVKRESDKYYAGEEAKK